MKFEDTIKQETNTLLLQLQKENAATESISPPSQPKPKPPVLFSKRFFVTVLLFFGNICVQLANQVINIAVIEMKSKKETSWKSSSDTWSNSFVEFLLKSPHFHWDMMTISMIVNMYSYGFLFSPIGGILAHKFGGAKILVVSTLLASIAVVLSPFSLRIHTHFFMACRILIGLLMNLQEWNMCFLWSSGVVLFVAFVYLIFGSSEKQPWSVPNPSNETIPESKICTYE